VNLDGSARPGRVSLSPELRRHIERWFIRRGVPQLIEGYSTEQGMDARAAPFISVWLVIGTVAFWGTNPEWPPEWNAAGIVATLLFMGLAYTAVAWIRRRPIGTRPEKFDFLDIGLFGVLPAIPAGVIDGSAAAAVIAGLNALLGVGIIYIIIGFGLVEIGLWALDTLRFQVVHIVELLAKTLPLLLILVVFLLFAAEIWEAAHGMHLGELVAVLVLLVVVASLLIVTTFRAEIRKIEERDDWDGVLADVRETPAAPLADALRRPLPRPPALSWIQHVNLGAYVLVSQLLQATFVALLLMAFLVAFGLMALPASVQEGWVGEPVRILARFDLLGEVRTLSAELLTVTALLSGIVGLYFTGLALTDAGYRVEHVTRVVGELRRLLSARALYLAALKDAAAARARR
jgi:hypothetical protein